MRGYWAKRMVGKLRKMKRGERRRKRRKRAVCEEEGEERKLERDGQLEGGRKGESRLDHEQQHRLEQ
jgi:hypothetical protein